MANKITPRKEDYSKWYNEIVVQADLAENSAVRGCMVIKPYGYAIWEKMQNELDKMFKEIGKLIKTPPSSRAANAWIKSQRPG